MEVDLVFLTSLLSVIVSIFVIISYIRYQSFNPPTFLKLAIRLIVADLFFSVGLLFWKLTVEFGPQDNLNLYCLFFHPILIFLIISGYGWTICIALRFKEIPVALNIQDMMKVESVVTTPYSIIVWTVSAIIVLPIVILNSMGAQYAVSGKVSVPHFVGSDYCFFYSSWEAQLVNNLCFQLPLVLTICINSFAFAKGLYALGNTPQSVVARKMRHAGRYLFALLAIWVPNFIINLCLELTPNVSHHSRSSGYGAIVTLCSCQGLVNCFIYVYSDHKFRQWVLEGGRRHSLFSSEAVSTYSIEEKEQSSHLISHLISVEEGGDTENTNSNSSVSSTSHSARASVGSGSGSGLIAASSYTSAKRAGRNSSVGSASSFRSPLRSSDRYVRFGQDEEFEAKEYPRSDTSTST